MSSNTPKRVFDPSPKFDSRFVLDAAPEPDVRTGANADWTSTPRTLVEYFGEFLPVTRWMWEGMQECSFCKEYRGRSTHHTDSAIVLSILTISLDLVLLGFLGLAVLIFLVGKLSSQVLCIELPKLFLRCHEWQAISFDANQMVTVVGSRQLARILPESVLDARLGRSNRRGQNGVGAMSLQSTVLESLNQAAGRHNDLQPLPAPPSSGNEADKASSSAGSASSPHHSSLPRNSTDVRAEISVRVFNKASQILKLPALLDTGCRPRPVDDLQLNAIAGLISENVLEFLGLDMHPLDDYTLTDFEGRPSSSQPSGRTQMSWQFASEDNHHYRTDTFIVVRELASDIIIGMIGITDAQILRWNSDRVRFQAVRDFAGSAGDRAEIYRNETERKVSFNSRWVSGSIQWRRKRTGYQEPQ